MGDAVGPAGERRRAASAFLSTGWRSDSELVQEGMLEALIVSGLRQVLDCRGSWVRDAEEWQDAGGVAGVAARRGAAWRAAMLP